MDTYLKLDNGLHTDFEPINQPAGTYRYMLNAVRQLSGAIENEKGTSIIQQFSSIGRRIVGSYALNNDIIICSVDANSNSEIGVLSNNIYTSITTNSALNFSLGSIIKMEGKKNFKGERLIYLVEKNGSNPMRVINIDDKNLLASSTFGDDIRLQINPATPSIDVTSVIDGGSLPTGIYQASARLLTRSTNSTPFGIISPIVSIINESTSVDYDQQDGALPQTPSPKSIVFTVSNIDTSYSFIEIAIITYVSTSNISQANLVARLPIDNRSSITFTYSSIDQNQESIDLEAIAIKPVIYDSAETIAQKDGILTLGNLTASSTEYDFQSIANEVKLKYVVEEIAYYPGYKDPLNVAKKKGYQRDEVYSFAIVPEFDGQYNTTAYHIPGNTLSINANTSTRQLGGYRSSETYPLDKNYPIGNVYHHRMPTISQEPLIVIRNGQTYIRVIGIELVLPDLTTIKDVKGLKGFNLVRQIRTSNNKSIIAQGIANTQVKENSKDAVLLSPFPKALYDGPAFMTNTTAIPNQIGFMSPETIIYNDLPIGLLKLRTVGELKGNQRLINAETNHNASDGTIANSVFFLNYNEANGLTSSIDDVDIVNNSAQYIPASAQDVVDTSTTNITIVGTNDRVNNFKNNGYLYLKLRRNLPMRQDVFTPNYSSTTSRMPELFYDYRRNNNDLIALNGKLVMTPGDTTNRYLYNIVRQLDNQYGAIYDATYIQCGLHKIDSANLPIFGGDIFIGKFGVVNTTGIFNNDEIIFKALSYFFCESGINVEYRHYSAPVGTEGQPNYVAGTTPYYPKLGVLYNDPKNTSLTPGILNLSWSLGHGRGYNKQYSFENSIIVYYPKQLAEEKVTRYGNRVIYSEQSVEGEQIDAYRIFLPNNYHDVPKDKGEITELFVHNHRYYIHTSGALYLSSFNDRVSQSSSIGEVYLGNGGVFNRPSEPILTLNGGYAGTTSSCGINTPYGRLFLDNLNNKVYLLADNLKEISEQGMFKYFAKEIKDIADSPSVGSGYITSYDLSNQRILLTKVGEWTISYSPQLNSWSSYHSYLPYWYSSLNQQLYSADSNKIWQHNVGAYGSYYGNIPSPMQLDLVINDAPNTTKTFDNLVFYTTSQNSEDIEQHYDTWNTLHCYNTTRNSGKCRLIVPRNFNEDFQTLGLYECFAKLKSNEFRVAIPNDLVLDVNQSIFVANNLATSRNYRPSMSGKWLVTSLTYMNLRNNKFVLHTIGRIFRHRIR